MGGCGSLNLVAYVVLTKGKVMCVSQGEPRGTNSKGQNGAKFAVFSSKPQIFAENRRKPPIFAETGLSHVVCPF